ncbi:MAG: NifB/NifX family molybdenum-iron cluster-binding protein [Methanomicrobiales archaeon]
MKIAIATDESVVSPHFGHASGYEVVEIEDGTVTSREFVESPGHSPGVLPALLRDHGVSIVIAGGMGPKAIDAFCNFGIDVYVGVEGPIDQVIEDWIAKKLTPGANVCHH